MKILFLTLLLTSNSWATHMGPIRFKAEVRSTDKNTAKIHWLKKDFTIPRSFIQAKKIPTPSVQEVFVTPEYMDAMIVSAAATAEASKKQ